MADAPSAPGEWAAQYIRWTRVGEYRAVYGTDGRDSGSRLTPDHDLCTCP